MNLKRALTAAMAGMIFLYCITGMVMAGHQKDTAAAGPAGNTALFSGRDEYVKIAETEYLVLFYNGMYSSIEIQDKRNGFVWSSSVKEDYYEGNIGSSLANHTNSLFYFSITDFEKAFTVASLASQADRQVYERLADNGLSVEYYFPKYKLGWTLEFWLQEDGLCLNIPADSIIEDGNHGLVSINLLPFFGASRNDENGYIFYPDGSGALMHFKGRDFSLPRQYSLSIYGEFRVEPDLYLENERQGIKTAMLPVFGLKRGENAFAAMMDAGEHDAAINLSLSGYIAKLNRISPEFKFRKDYTHTTSDNKTINLFEKAMVRTERRITYRFLTGEDANYSGMANAYRSHLVDSGKLRQVIGGEDNIPLGLDLFMGIKEKRLLFDKYVAMTTFRQARTILETFTEQGAKDLLVQLVGWTQKGYGAFPVHLPPSRRLGGAMGLKSLAEYTRDTGIRLFLQDNYVNAYSENRRFSKRSDTVLTEARMVVTNGGKDEFLLNPGSSWRRFSSDYIHRVSEYGVDGISFEKFGTLLFHDYHRVYPSTREGTSEYWNRFMIESKNRLGYSAVEGGNAYVLSSADRLFKIPVESSGYFYTDETIPFFQMVVHGMIPYSSEPGNLFYDLDMQKLKWVEYGCMPYFELTYQNPGLLKYTDYNFLFTSQYRDWVETAVDIYREFNERLGSVWPQIMKEHNKITANVYKTMYGDGTCVYVNYNERSIKADGFEIPPVDYLVVDREGNTR